VSIKWLYSPSKEMVDDIRNKLIPALRGRAVNAGEISFRFDPAWTPQKAPQPADGSSRPWLCLGVSVHQQRELDLGDIWEHAQKARGNGWQVFILLLRFCPRNGAPDITAALDDLSLTPLRESTFVLKRFNTPFHVFEVFMDNQIPDVPQSFVFSLHNLMSGSA